MPSQKRFAIQQFQNSQHDGEWVPVEWPYDFREPTNGPMEFDTLDAAEQELVKRRLGMGRHVNVRILDRKTNAVASHAQMEREAMVRQNTNQRSRAEKLEKALEEIQGFVQRNKERAQKAYDDAEPGSREELLAEARLHEATRIEAVITYRVEEAKS